MSYTNSNIKKNSYAKPPNDHRNYNKKIAFDTNIKCPIQMKILVSPSSPFDFHNNITMSPILYRNNKRKAIDSYENNADSTTTTTNNNSKDISYQTPKQETNAPDNKTASTTTSQYSSSSSLTNNSKSCQYSPVTPRQPPQYTTPNSKSESVIYTTPSLKIHQEFSSPSFSCEDISPIFFDFRKVHSSTPPEVTSSILPPVPTVSELKYDGSSFGRIPVCQEITSKPSGGPSYYPPPMYQTRGKENRHPQPPNPPKISPDFIKSQQFTPPCPPCQPASTSRRYRRKCEVPSCPNRVVQGGVCISHGAKRKLCGFPGCTKHVKKAGMCSKHGPPRKRCDLEGCTKVAVQGGRCIAHGARKRICSQVGCNRQVFSFGLCKKHRMEE